MSGAATRGYQNLSQQAREAFELSEIIAVKASTWPHKSISPRKLELKQPFAYPTAHKLGSFNTNKNHTRRGDSLFGKLENFLQFFSSPDTSFPVWGKFKLPTAQAAPKFLLAEGEGKRELVLPRPPPLCRTSTAWGCSCAWRAAAAGGDCPEAQGAGRSSWMGRG